MYGSSFDSRLNVLRKYFNSDLNGTVIWTDMNNYGDFWNNAKVSLPNNISNYVLLFEGVSGSSSYADIGLDDIKITNELCPSTECVFTCSNGTCLTSTQVCNFVNDCLNGEEEIKCGYNETFENDSSGWNETSNGLFKWKRGSNVIGNGPAVDHTSGLTSGYYIYVDSNVGTSNSNSRYSSPILRDSWSTCQTTFWYQIMGNNIGAIEIYLNVGFQQSRIFKITNPTNNQWIQATVNIGRYRTDFSLDITAYRSFKVNGFIAVDDIEFKSNYLILFILN
jgi:hypothetical protein